MVGTAARRAERSEVPGGFSVLGEVAPAGQGWRPASSRPWSAPAAGRQPTWGRVGRSGCGDRSIAPVTQATTVGPTSPAQVVDAPGPGRGCDVAGHVAVVGRRSSSNTASRPPRSDVASRLDRSPNMTGGRLSILVGTPDGLEICPGPAEQPGCGDLVEPGIDDVVEHPGGFGLP